MFRYLSRSTKPTIELQINQQSVSVPEGSSVWAAMAVSGETTTRLAPVTGQARSAHCAMGICFECLVEVNGQPNRQACLTEAQEGMCVNRQEITQNTCLEGVTPFTTPAKNTAITESSDDV
ncbi:MAG: (2Fe-2S)-binding protein [Pontibacterium sp.]